MVVENEQNRSIPIDERVKDYKAAALLSAMGSRIYSVRFHWAMYLFACQREAGVEAEGYLRLSVDNAVGLAARPAGTREEAVSKATVLTLVVSRMRQRVDGAARRDLRGAMPMLSAAVDAEVSRWRLRCPKPSDVDTPTGFGDRAPNPRKWRELHLNAEPRALALALGDAELMYVDRAALDAEKDLAAIYGIDDRILVTLLRSLAIPATSLEELEEKIRVIEDWAEFLQPSEMTLPMLVAVLGPEGERFERGIDLDSLLARPQQPKVV